MDRATRRGGAILQGRRGGAILQGHHGGAILGRTRIEQRLHLVAQTAFFAALLLGIAAPSSAQAQPAAPPVASEAGADRAATPTQAPQNDTSAERPQVEPLPPLEVPTGALDGLVVDTVSLQGVAFSRKPALLARVGFGEGDHIDEAAVAEARIALLATGLFHDVRPRLSKGSARGHVRVIFDCDERGTLSIDALHLGHARPTNLWGGLELSDLDPFGVGWSVDAGLVASGDQLSARLGTGPRTFFNTPLILRFRLNAVLGDEPFVGPKGQLVAGEAVEQVRADYRRLGAGADLTLPLGDHRRLTAAAGIERLDFATPAGATQLDQDGQRRAFDFDASDGWLRMASLTLSHDTRDDPALPTRGTRAALRLQGGLLDGAFLSAQASVEQVWRLPFGHVIRADALIGGVFGAAPFFERFFVGDLHPWVPGRAMGLNFASRRGPYLLGGAIAAQRYETVAGRAGLEYRIPLSGRTAANPYGVELFVGSALIGLGTPDEPGQRGVPLDVAFDLGLRIESRIGVMGLSLSNLFLLVDP